MKNWPEYKSYYRNCRNTTEVNAFLKKLDLADNCDTRYLKNYIRDKGSEFDFDSWLDNTETFGASIQIEFFPEYDPRNSFNILTRFAACDKEATGNKVVKPAYYEVRVTKYTKTGLAAL